MGLRTESTLHATGTFAGGSPETPSGKVRSIAIVAQMHNVALWPELAKCIATVAEIRRAPQRQNLSIDLHLSLTGENNTISDRVQRLRAKVGLEEASVTVVSNLGADIGQFLQQVQIIGKHNSTSKFKHYDLLLKIHSKTADVWRKHMMDALCGHARNVENLVRTFEKQQNIGMVGSGMQTFRHNLLPSKGHIKHAYRNIYPGERLSEKDYRLVAGSWFWSRAAPFLENSNLLATIPAWLRVFPRVYHTAQTCAANDAGCNLMFALERVFPTMIKAHFHLDVAGSWRKPMRIEVV